MSKVALNIYNLQKGDILLTSMTDELSLSIQKMIGSKFTHACLYLGNASFIEATLDGVNYFSPLYFVFDNIEDLKVLRLKNESEITNLLLDKIEVAAREFSFRQYAQLTAIKAGKLKEAENMGHPNIDTITMLSEWEKSVHCSQLVALSYNIGANVNIISTKKPENITPADILESDLLKDVTEEVTLFIIDDSTELEAKSYPHSPENSILTQQTIVTQQALKGMKNIFQKIGVNLPPDIGLVINMLLTLDKSVASQIDVELNKVLQGLGYFNLWAIYEEDYKKNSDESIAKLKERIKSGEINETNYNDHLVFLEFGIETTYNTITKQKWNLVASKNNLHQTGFSTHKSLCSMYLNFLKFLTSVYKEKLEAYEFIQTTFENE